MFARLLAICAVLGVAFAFQNCAPVDFASKASSASTDGTPSDQNSPPPGGTPIPVSEVLKAFQPAVAVRGMACLLCHADIRSSVITDFGLGKSDNFLGGTHTFDNADTKTSDQSWYNNTASTWQGASIQGTVVVPDVNVTPQALALIAPNASSMKLADLMQTAYAPKYYYSCDSWPSSGCGPKTPPAAMMSMVYGVKPMNGAPAVQSASSITIRAPSETEISSLAPGLLDAEFQRIGGSSAVELTTTDNGNGKFVTNPSGKTLSCANSDIVVKGTLYLKNLSVNANGGCRLYVTGSVFIEGPISYAQDSGNSNLQITSARAIVMGINTTKLQNRLLSDSRGVQLQSLDYSTLANQVLSEANSIGTLADADTGSGRTSLDFNGLLLNAPMIHSRYLGHVKGAIISEIALFAIGQFHFEYDPTLGQTKVLPLLQAPILDVH